jgi:hypothetical protein
LPIGQRSSKDGAVASQDERRAVEMVAARLSATFPETPAKRVESVVDQTYHELDGAPIRDFVAILVEKQARERLAHPVG